MNALRAATTSLLALVALGTGCSSWRASYFLREMKSNVAEDHDAGDDQAPFERLTLGAGGHTFRDVRLDGARVWGSSFEVAHLVDGYRGSSPYGFLFLSENVPGEVSGVIGNGGLTELRYETDAATGKLYANGRGSWKETAVVATHDSITASRRFCSDTYRRVAGSDAFAGRPSFWQADPLGATLHVPDVFFERAPGEQIVILTMFLA